MNARVDSSVTLLYNNKYIFTQAKFSNFLYTDLAYTIFSDLNKGGNGTVAHNGPYLQ